MKSIKALITTLLLTLALLLPNNTLMAHCEIPCGIFEDTLRIELMKEHVGTIEKSMKQIAELSKEGEINYNQLVRWIENKEKHANELQEIASQYFLYQRIKITAPTDTEAYKKYNTQLRLLHEITVYAMKAKQSTDLQWIDKLKLSIDAFEHIYFNPHKH